MSTTPLREAGSAPDGAAVVVVNYGAHELLEHHLPRLSGAGVRVVVADNFSSVDERTAVTELCRRHDWQLVPLPDNRGFGPAANAGIASALAAGSDVVVLLNPDALAEPGVVTDLADLARRAPDRLFSPRVVTPSGATEFAGSRLMIDDGRIRGVRSPRLRPERPQVPWLTGACVAAHRDAWDRVGGFDPGYFLYWEDVDLSWRALRSGLQLEVVEELTIQHDEGGTQAARVGRAKTALYYRYNARNRLVFAARNLPRRLVLRWLLTTPAVSWEILMRGGRRQLLQSPRPAVEIVRGSLAGAGIAVRELLRRHRPGPLTVPRWTP